AVGHAIPAGGLGVDDYVAYQLIVKEVEERLTESELSQFRALIRGERFEGRRALLRKIGPYFQDFTGEK
ncbi:TPA: competence protein ComX, partial [Streptococcus equi subsp. zooepidemicus]|nr:competence protein ComX [Streptococcus equi subsp. zooepidemicus]HEL0094742.1 competence protein ComX [Streptococcus equi subsp. zooepidemicus]HEL0351702.1 competence protein ComX [Streptococcus equi subsp. zooepidemicus]HEL0498510.1 competence protein ComX [Streptococcus equi subsp. zooepidemicus]